MGRLNLGIWFITIQLFCLFDEDLMRLKCVEIWFYMNVASDTKDVLHMAQTSRCLDVFKISKKNWK